MAAKKRWWHPKIADQLKWFANYPEALASCSTALEVTEDELTQAQEDAAMFIYIYEYYQALVRHEKVVRTYLKGLINGKAAKDLGAFPVFTMTAVPATVLSGLLARTFKFIISIKTRKGYTSTIGKKLMVIGNDSVVFIEADYIANGKAKTSESGIIISFKKGKNITGMSIFCQRGESKEFVEIFRATKNKWPDKRPNLKEGVPEVRTYHTRAFIDNNLIGESSPDFDVTWLSPPIPKEKVVEEKKP